MSDEKEFRREHDLYLHIIDRSGRGASDWHPNPLNPKQNISHYVGYLRNKYGKERSNAYVDAYFAASKDKENTMNFDPEKDDIKELAKKAGDPGLDGSYRA